MNTPTWCQAETAASLPRKFRQRVLPIKGRLFPAFRPQVSEVIRDSTGMMHQLSQRHTVRPTGHSPTCLESGSDVESWPACSRSKTPVAVKRFEIEAMLRLVPGVIAMCDSRSARPRDPARPPHDSEDVDLGSDPPHPTVPTQMRAHMSAKSVRPTQPLWPSARSQCDRVT